MGLDQAPHEENVNPLNLITNTIIFHSNETYQINHKTI